MTLQQNFWRCTHYPSAIENWWERRGSCEHLCHTTELRWYHNGTHQLPQKSVADQIFGV